MNKKEILNSNIDRFKYTLRITGVKKSLNGFVKLLDGRGIEIKKRNLKKEDAIFLLCENKNNIPTIYILPKIELNKYYFDIHVSLPLQTKYLYSLLELREIELLTPEKEEDEDY